MTVAEITLISKDYRFRQELQRVISERELLYRYEFDGDTFRFETERELTRQQVIGLIPVEAREHIDDVRIIPHAVERKDRSPDGFDTAYNLYYVNK